MTSRWRSERVLGEGMQVLVDDSIEMANKNEQYNMNFSSIPVGYQEMTKRGKFGNQWRLNSGKNPKLSLT